MQTARQIRRAAAKKEQRRLRKANSTNSQPSQTAPGVNKAPNEANHPATYPLEQQVTDLQQVLEATLTFAATVPDPQHQSKTTSAARQAANQRNAQSSTGPQTPEGKRRASLNAVRTGLTGKTILLATDDADAYAALCRRYQRDWNPTDGREQELVQMLADTQWRLNRIPSLEAGLFAAGRIAWHDQVQAEFAGADPALVNTLLELHIHTVQENKLRNLHLQESRLRRYYQVTLAELKQLQKERKAMEAEAPLPARTKPSSPPNGFVFANHASAAPAVTHHPSAVPLQPQPDALHRPPTAGKPKVA